MRRTLLLSLIAFWPLISKGQDSINPYIIQQKCNIELHYTDVYYNPFAPPDPSIWRGQLCNESAMLLSPDGIGGGYQPMVHTFGELHDTVLSNWQPHGTPLGQFAVWQRLFQGDTITAGGLPGDSVIISKGEDVDFRATHLIKLKSGFHAKPGCFFHAYIAPKFDTAVFSDEFDSTSVGLPKWHVSNGWGGNDNYPEGAQCTYDTNVYLDTDYQAHDGYALDIIIRENTDTCRCFTLVSKDSCGNFVSSDSAITKFIFSSGMIRSCPFPLQQRLDTPFVSAYAHAPYGKYEIREKIPHVMHHTNNWGAGRGYGFEYDLNETDYGGNMGIISPSFNHSLRRGPFTGAFSTIGDTVIFVSPDAHWCLSNNPSSIIIDNVAYPVEFFPRHGMDTLCGYFDPVENGRLRYPDWPSSLATSTNSFTFYYSIVTKCFADTLPWTVDTDSHGTWRIFNAAYHDSSGTLLHFSKANQPASITLHVDPFKPNHAKTLNCHWEYNLNDTGCGWLLYLDDTMLPTDLHSNTEAYGFAATDLYSGSEGYPIPPLPFNADDTAGHYEYHTFAMEFLPHEVRILVDSVVVRRLPDRLIPVGSPYYDWITTLPRAPIDILPAETDIDYDLNDPFGVDTSHGSGWYGLSSITNVERRYFEHALSVPGWPGVWGGAAHHLIDYIKVWDVPKDVIIPDLPH